MNHDKDQKRQEDKNGASLSPSNMADHAVIPPTPSNTLNAPILTSLFDPPPPTPSNTLNASILTSLGSPPPPTPSNTLNTPLTIISGHPPPTPTNTLNTPNLTNLVGHPTATDREGNDQDKGGAQSSGAGSLQSLFAPPATAVPSDAHRAMDPLLTRTSPSTGATSKDSPSRSNQLPLHNVATSLANVINSGSADSFAKTPPVSHLKSRLNEEKLRDDSMALPLNSLFLPPMKKAPQPISNKDKVPPASQLNTLFQPPVQHKPISTHNVAANKSQPVVLSQFNTLFQPPPEKKKTVSNETTALLSEDSSALYNGSPMKAQEGDLLKPQESTRRIPDCGLGQPPTYAGAVMFLLYHVVFCLANGSAIIRPHSSRPILGIMAKMSTLGIMVSGPFYILRLGKDIPALYPSVDLFLAPFLARAAAAVDQSLSERYEDDYPEEVFFGSFCVLTGIGMFLSGLLLHLGATFKLANLGTFLPYSVLCGFFSAVGVLLWALAFTVDTSGKTWQQVFFSGDSELILESLMHHAPSLFMGIVMNRLGPKNPFFVLLLLFVTWGFFYLVMFLTNTSLEEAQEAHWFWSKKELVVDHDEIPFRVLPLCNFFGVFSVGGASVDWLAVRAGLNNMIALAFLYLLRSSIHASALKKNVANLVRRVPVELGEVRGQNQQEDSDDEDDGSAISSKNSKTHSTARTGNIFNSVRLTVRQVQWSLAGDAKEIPNAVLSTRVSAAMLELDPAMLEQDDTEMYTEVRAKPTKRSLEEIFCEYGYALYIVALFGGFGCCPTVATSKTMYAIRADGFAPQFGSVILLLVFFMTDFDVVQYIPKAAFSSLLVLGAVDTLAVWFFDAFTKTLDVSEWLVVPIIVAFSLVIGFLNAVLVGIAISTFVFVGAFFRVGIVKFQATGKDIRSRIERSMEQCVLLNEHGDEIQVLVLQNYLFFGNAAKLCHYIFTMFEDVEIELEESSDITVPPFPKVLLLDFSLTTGLDTSTVDIFNDIKEKCQENDCKLFLSGLTTRMRKALALGGIKPEAHLSRRERIVRLFADMDTGLGSAEDFLISLNAPPVRHDRIACDTSTEGFRSSLQKIDELHCQNFAESLVDLEPFVEPLELSPGDVLFAADGGIIRDEERGLFFIECGTLKISRDSSMSLTLNRTRSYGHLGSFGASSGSLGVSNGGTISNRHARLQSLARSIGRSKHQSAGTGSPDNFRLARIGPGWVIGTLENASGTQSPGIVTAMTRCRLYHLPFTTMEEMESTNPLLVLKLYKMLSHLMAKKEEITSEHLSTLHTIMSSHANPKHLNSRTSMSSFSGGSG